MAQTTHRGRIATMPKGGFPIKSLCSLPPPAYSFFSAMFTVHDRTAIMTMMAMVTVMSETSATMTMMMMIMHVCFSLLHARGELVQIRSSTTRDSKDDRPYDRPDDRTNKMICYTNDRFYRHSPTCRTSSDSSSHSAQYGDSGWPFCHLLCCMRHFETAVALCSSADISLTTHRDRKSLVFVWAADMNPNWTELNWMKPHANRNSRTL